VNRFTDIAINAERKAVRIILLYGISAFTYHPEITSMLTFLFRSFASALPQPTSWDRHDSEPPPATPTM